MKTENVLISILNWNGLEKTKRCIESILKLDYAEYDILVIDNASTDNSLVELKNKYPNIFFIENKTNTGFAGGQNQGINFAIEKSYDYVWILNNDTTVNTDTLSVLVNSLSSSPSCAAISPIILNHSDGSIQFCGCTIDYDHRYFNKFDSIDSLILNQDRSPEKIFLWGTAVLIKTRTLTDIGGFSEKYFAYFEDMDLSARIINHGMTNMVSPNAFVYHEGENNPETRPPYYVYYNTRNKYFFWMQHIKNSEKTSFRKQYLADALLLAAEWHRKGEKELEIATLLAISDAIIGKSGRWIPNRKIPFVIRFILLKRPYFFVNILRGKSPLEFFRSAR